MPPMPSKAGLLPDLVGPRTFRLLADDRIGLAADQDANGALIPDKADDAGVRGGSVFIATCLAFFLAEMGDKTQIATVALAARYHAFAAVVAGTTLGMMIANVPAVLIGGRLAHRLPIRLVHAVAAAIFAALGIAVLIGVGA